MTDFPEEGLQSTLQSAAAVQSLNPSGGVKVYPTRLPKDVVLPAITYQKISGERDLTRDGPSGLAMPMFQVTCWTDGDPIRTANGAKLCAQIAQGVRITLNGKTHLWDQVDAIPMLVNEMDRFEPESQTHMRVLDFQVIHREEIGP